MPDPTGEPQPDLDDRAAWAEEDDLTDYRPPLRRMLVRTRSWLAILLAVALVVRGGTWMVDELAFRRSADDVVATLDGTLQGTDAAAAVALVRTVGCAGEAGTGSAFVVDTPSGPALLTNRHVVEWASAVSVRRLDTTTTIPVTQVHISLTADVAVLEIDDPEALPPPLALDPDTPSVGTPVRLVGFPGATPFTAAGEVDAVDSGRLLLELEVAPGASGSPVVTDDGRVVGQVHGIADDGRGVATPVDRLLGAIDDAVPAPEC